MKPVSKWVTGTREVSCHARLATARDTKDKAGVGLILHRLVAHQQVAELSAVRPVLKEEVLREFPLPGLIASTYSSEMTLMMSSGPSR